MNFYLLDVEYKKMFRNNKVKKVAIQASNEEHAKKIYKMLHSGKTGILKIASISFTEFLEYSRK